MTAEPSSPPDVFDGVATVTHGDVLLSLWREPARVPRVRRVMELTEDLLRRTSGSIVACQFL
ncbi:MAG: hypothetical protein IT373_24075, partial [Polyangiaceae bacterium]|nr:hypothetical protein [Polyangiaceae bacterium]